MANWRLSGDCRRAIGTCVDVLCGKRLGLAESGFPLTQDDMTGLLVSPRRLELYRALEADGVKNLSTRTQAEISVGASFNLGRHVIIIVKGFKVYNTGDKKLVSIAPSRKGVKGGHLFKDLWALSPLMLPLDKREAIAEWLRVNLRTARLAARTRDVVAAMLDELPTVGHVHARWPVIAALMANHDEYGTILTHKPARLRPEWGWGADPRIAKVYDSEVARKLRAGAETFLLSAEMLPDPPTPQGVRAHIEAWQILEGDKTIQARLSAGATA